MVPGTILFRVRDNIQVTFGVSVEHKVHDARFLIITLIWQYHFSEVSMTKSDSFPVFNEKDKPYGKTYGEWTANWWQWALSTPKDCNGVADETGQHWKTCQPQSDVYFLAGNIAKVVKTFPHRSIRMEYGRSILLPILNCQANSLEYPHLRTHDDLIKHVVHDVQTVVKKELFINGTRIDPIHVPSEPKIFSVIISEDNAFEIDNTGLTDAAADGYWVFLKPLPRGNYAIKLEGSCESGRLYAGAFYTLEIF